MSAYVRQEQVHDPAPERQSVPDSAPAGLVRDGATTRLKLLTGSDALESVASDAFQVRWKTLHGQCPWATACQHPDFVVTWYRCYQSRAVPVIVCAEGDDGALVGLLPLALHPGATRLSGAGDHQAEYQGWIQSPNGGDGFIVQAVGLLRAAFPRADICLRYLPPGIALNGFEPGGRYADLVSLHPHRRPLMKIDAAAMARQRNKKNHRQNANRLGRIGTVGFEKIDAHERFIDVFGALCLQYDFRQAALYRSMPFATDPLKKLFYLALHRQGVLHVTVLTVNGAIAASHIGLVSQQRSVHLGINTHDPALAAHSPGNLLLAMLGVQLATENIPWLDLTPGGDRYKEHFASDHDVVYELTVYSSKARRWRREATSKGIRLVKDCLHMAGYRPANILAITQKLESPAALGLQLCSSLKNRLVSRRREFNYRGEPPQMSASALPVSKNKLGDLIGFDSHGAPVRYRDFLHQAMENMERSSDVYSYVRGSMLCMSCWARTVIAEPGPTRSSGAPAPGTIVLSDLYVHRSARQVGAIAHFLMGIVSELARDRPEVSIRYRGRVDDELGAALKTCGFSATNTQPRVLQAGE